MSTQYTFQAETQQLLDILIHSLYTEREIFLRELVSNASDALNRMQFEQLTNTDVLDPEAELAIEVKVDGDAKTITISDSGIGMTQEEMIENLGTIARSGAKNFIQAVRSAANSSDAAQNIIGQFGVGFYSVFMVADKVQVISRSFRPDAQAVVWESDGGTTYTIEPAEKVERGTDVIIHIKEDASEFLSDFKLRDIVKRHSNYVAFPIYVGEQEEPANEQTAIWRKAPKEIDEEAYNSFYRLMTMDFGEPLHRLHIRADVPMQYYGLLFFPSSAEPNMFSLRKEPGLKLYARKILIDEYNNDLLPPYLQFVQGVVDSEDLPLNVSRESVKSDRIMANLKKTLTTRILSDLKKMASNERESYLAIHAEFGRFIKQGLVITPQDKDDLVDLIFFNSSHDDNEDNFYSLDDYAQRMATGQNDIYYVIADDFNSARRSPHLDAFRQRGIEVLYFSDPVDAMLPMGLTEYKGHPMRSVDEAEIDLKDVGEEKESELRQRDALATDPWEHVVARIRAVLGDRVSDVRQSKTLVSSAARLVSDDSSGNRHMYRINRLLDREYELPVKALEINPRHPLTHNLSQMIGQNADNSLIDVVVEQLFETSLLQDGLHPDPAAMAQRMMLLMEAATGTPLDELNYQDALTPRPAAGGTVEDVIETTTEKPEE